MNCHEFRRAIYDLGYDETKFAKLVDVTPRTVRRWAAMGNDKVHPAKHPPKAIALLVSLMTMNGVLKVS